MKYLKNFDKFGENFSFKYNKYDKYSSRMGGFIFLIFFLIALLHFILKCIPFYQKKNYSLQFYTINNSTEKIILFENFAYGIVCENKDDKKIFNSDKFNLMFFYNSLRTDDKIETENCTSTDFGINLINDLENINNSGNLPIYEFNCIKTKNIIEGIYTEENFSFYKIKVESHDDNVEEIEELLNQNECKLQFYYKDYFLDIEAHKNPIKPKLNSLFIQINPDFDVKKNVYFMKYHFKNEDKLIDIPFLTSSEDEQTVVGFSRTDDYFLYNTTSSKNDSKRYATLYIRADNRKTVINRKYQNLLDFYAENTSIWFGIFEVLNIFFTFYNGFHANLSMSKKLFFFDEIKEDNKYNILRKDSLKSNNNNKTILRKILRKGTINSNNNIINIKNIDEITINDNNEQKYNDQKDVSVVYSKKNYNKYIIPSEKHLSSEEEPNISKKSQFKVKKMKIKKIIILVY